MKKGIVLSIVLAALLPACVEGGEPDLAPAAEELVIWPPPEPALPTPDRMLWDLAGTAAELWLVTNTNSVGATVNWPTGPVGPGWFAASVAGNKILWQQYSLYPWTGLWTVGGNGQYTSSVQLFPPVPNAYATSISLAQVYRGECYVTSDEQRYWLLWDQAPSSEYPNGQFIVQLIDGDGFVRQTIFTPKPLSGLAAVSFTKAADGWEHVVFRGNDGAAWVYRAVAQATSYQLTSLATVRRSGYRFASSNIKYFNYLFNWGWRDQLLFDNGNGSAILASFDDLGAPRGDVTFTRAGGGNATSHASLPSVCP